LKYIIIRFFGFFRSFRYFYYFFYFFYFCFISLLIIGHTAQASFKNYTKFPWSTIETKHFIIHYHRGAEHCAAIPVEYGDKWFDQINKLIKYPLKEKIHVVVRDDMPEPGGEAFSDSDLLIFMCTDLHSPFRGKTRGLGTVFVHELIHDLTLKKQSYFSELSTMMELEFNTDHKANDYIVNNSISISDVNRSMWWTEGIAQFINNQIGISPWTSQRHMMLRSAFIQNKLLKWEELDVFSDKKGLEGERLYNQGFDMLRFVSEKFGADKPMEIASARSKQYLFNWKDSVKLALGISGEKLYKMWFKDRTNKIKAFYKKRGKIFEGIPFVIEDTKKDEDENREARDRPIGINYFKMSPDGKHAAFVSDAWPFTLRIVSFKNVITKPIDLNKLPAGIGDIEVEDVNFGQVDFSSDSKYIVYSKLVDPLFDTKAEYMIDLYELRLSTGTERRITYNKRARDPAYSPDGKEVAFNSCFDSTCNLSVVQRSKGRGRTRILFNKDKKLPEFWIYGIDYSPDGKNILMGVRQVHQTFLALFNRQTNRLKVLIKDEFDNHDPVYSSKGKGIYYSTERSGGVHDIHYLDLSSLRSKPVTRVRFGAFAPFPFKGAVYYSHFTAFGFRINKITSLPPKAKMVVVQKTKDPLIMQSKKDVSMLLKKQKPYSALDNNYQPMIMVPRMGYSNRDFFGGGYVEMGDYLERHKVQFFVQLSRDWAAGLTYINHQLLPTITLSVSHYASHYSTGEYIEDTGQGWFFGGYRKSKYIYDFATLDVTFDLNSTTHLSFLADYSRGSMQSSFEGGELTLLYEGVKPAVRWFYDENDDSFDINPNDVRKFLFQTGPVIDVYNSMPLSFKSKLAYTEFIPVPGTDYHTLDFAITLEHTTDYVNSDDYSCFQYRTPDLSTTDGLPTYMGSGYEVSVGCGEKMFAASLGYRFPIVRNMNKKLWIFYFKDIYTTIFSSVGNAWSYDQDYFSEENIPSYLYDYYNNVEEPEWLLKKVGLLTDAGIEFRISSYIHNNFPWNGMIRVAYGFDNVVDWRDVDNDRLSPVYTGEIDDFETEGKRLRFYSYWGTTF